MRVFAEHVRQRGQRIAVVPTMGFLHDGHLSLLKIARERGDVLIMTLFVNPTQFGPNEDLGRYPRDEAGDVAKATGCGVDAVFAPEPSEMYSANHQTSVQVDELAKPLCGAFRAGHFTGVASVVTKLFHLTLPHVAVFGEKDYQQLAIIRRMVRDLDFGIDIVSGPIVREPDGLALSSRNAYLQPDERTQAPALQQALAKARAAFAAGERDPRKLEQLARAHFASAPLCKVEYLDCLDADSLQAINRIDRPAVLAVAARLPSARLIDNVVLTP